MKRQLLALLLLVVGGSVWAQIIPEPVEVEDNPWRCAVLDGPAISANTSMMASVYACQQAAAQDPGRVFAVSRMEFTVSVDATVPPPPPPPPAPDPCPFDPPGAGVPIDDPSCVQPPPPPPGDDTSVTLPLESPLLALGPVSDLTVFPNDSLFAQAVFRWEVEFTANLVTGTQGLVSRDQNGQSDAGHLSVWLDNDVVVLRHQDISGGHASAELRSTTRVVAGQSYIITISVGPTGIALFVGTNLEAWDPWSVGTAGNSLDLVLAGLCTRCQPDGSFGPDRPLNGTAELRIYDSQAQWDPPAPITGDITLDWIYPTQRDDDSDLTMAEIMLISIYRPGGVFLRAVDPPLDTYTFVDLIAGQYCYYATATAVDPGGGDWLESRPSNSVCKVIQ